jgi:hypothetical protein
MISFRSSHDAQRADGFSAVIIEAGDFVGPKEHPFADPIIVVDAIGIPSARVESIQIVSTRLEY